VVPREQADWQGAIIFWVEMGPQEVAAMIEKEPSSQLLRSREECHFWSEPVLPAVARALHMNLCRMKGCFFIHELIDIYS
jgi:hypothetical protein